jgi:hypothetical protein
MTFSALHVLSQHVTSTRQLLPGSLDAVGNWQALTSTQVSLPGAMSNE